ncbi:uncharacterized protein PV07_11591 [Cladophialophora immunda]|uniref:ABM domain-containing protein n=1 Tax=Cladophialophora immunda TaxID=569365 RepID=A0A0D1Z700_9EURO|nr:uncharacterized protein PV07_11591 [Cladophialophora immunda]KIW23386.1 hypothetical protein PV07_11591 [Cladophialophora immunda]OQV03752.1 hypothetical protein CLAIMM_08754 [Cladophialophora immunda]
MPLIELATVRLHPSLSSNLTDSFTATWTRACGLATSAANGVPFQLYHSIDPTTEDVYYLVGGWQSGDDHIAFLSTPDAVALAKSIGEYMTVALVRHVDGDISALGQEDGGRPKRLRVTAYQVPESMIDNWALKWNNSPFASTGAGGWDLSSSVQKQHKAFKQMGEATNSVAAFGGKDESGSKTWVWLESSGNRSEETERSQYPLEGFENIQAEVFEMKYVVG